MKACAPVIHEATVRVMEVRRFKGSVGSTFYRQCPKCFKKVGPQFDPSELPGMSHPASVKWAQNPPRAPGNSKRRKYQAYMRSAAWRRKRAQRLDMDNFTCKTCGEPANEVHHLTYDGFGGQERMDQLRSTCSDCHKGEHPEMWGQT